MKTYNEAQTQKDRERLTRALIDLEAASLALANADRTLALSMPEAVGETQAAALDYYQRALRSIAAAFVAVRSCRERAEGLAVRPACEVLPFNDKAAEMLEAAGLPSFSLASKEGDK